MLGRILFYIVIYFLISSIIRAIIRRYRRRKYYQKGSLGRAARAEKILLKTPILKYWTMINNPFVYQTTQLHKIEIKC